MEPMSLHSRRLMLEKLFFGYGYDQSFVDYAMAAAFEMSDDEFVANVENIRSDLADMED